MFRSLKAATLAAALAGTVLAATPAQARDDYRYRDDDDAALAIGAGIVGLVIGLAIADDNDGRYYHDRRYYPDYPRHYYRDYPRHYRQWHEWDHDWRYRDRERYWRDRNWSGREWRGHDRDRWSHRRGWRD